MKVFKYSLKKCVTPIALIIFVAYFVALIVTFPSLPLEFEKHFLVLTVALIGGLAAHVIFSALLVNSSLVKLSDEMIYSSSLWSKKKCGWPDIAEVKVSRVGFLYYLNLCNDNGDILMLIPHKWMAKQDEFEADIREYTPVDHPLRGFISCTTD
jgi:hypothetical protein